MSIHNRAYCKLVAPNNVIPETSSGQALNLVVVILNLVQDLIPNPDPEINSGRRLRNDKK